MLKDKNVRIISYKKTILNALKIDLIGLIVLVSIIIFRDGFLFLENHGILISVFSLIVTISLGFAFVYGDKNPSRISNVFFPFQLFIIVIAFCMAVAMSFKAREGLYFLLVMKSPISVILSYFIKNKS